MSVHDEGEGQPEGLQPEDRAVMGYEPKPVKPGQTLVPLGIGLQVDARVVHVVTDVAVLTVKTSSLK